VASGSFGCLSKRSSVFEVRSEDWRAGAFASGSGHAIHGSGIPLADFQPFVDFPMKMG